MKRLLAIAGLGVGLGLGVLYAWVINPTQYTDTTPAALREDYRAEYIQLVARAFDVDEDIDRARARLALLGEANLAQAVIALAQRTAASQGDPNTIRALSELAAALGAGPASATPPAVALATQTAAPSGTPSSPSATPKQTLPPAMSTATVVPTITPRLLPTRTPTATPLGAFQYVGKQLVCDPNLAASMIQVVTIGALAEQIPGVEVIVEWEGGFDHFFTGLKPELGDGYGDFAMAEGMEYTIHLADSPSAMITGIVAERCTAEGGVSYWGSWLLIFRQ